MLVQASLKTKIHSQKHECLTSIYSYFNCIHANNGFVVLYLKFQVLDYVRMLLHSRNDKENRSWKPDTLYFTDICHGYSLINVQKKKDFVQNLVTGSKHKSKLAQRKASQKFLGCTFQCGGITDKISRCFQMQSQ